MRFIPLHSEPATLPACTSASSACRGGDLPCPTADACRVAEDIALDAIGPGLVAIGLLLAIASFVTLSVRGDLPGAQPAAAASAPVVALGASR
jgi:hypothetical protein